MEVFAAAFRVCDFATLLPVVVTLHLILLQNVGSNATESIGAENK